MEPIWLEHYPSGVPAEANIMHFASLKDMRKQSCERFRERPAFTNMDFTLSDGDLDRVSQEFGAYLRHALGLKRGARHGLEEVRLTPDDIAFLQYTGGTTGVAQGAIPTHGNLVANVEQTSAWIGSVLKEGEEVAISPLPLCHISALTANLLTFVKWGANDVLVTNPLILCRWARWPRPSW